MGTKRSHGTKILYWLADDAVGASLGSMSVLVGCANKTRWGQWFARAFAAWPLSSVPDKTAMLRRLQWGKKNGDYVTFLSRSHCVVCQPARWFLYHATVSCKGPLACGTGVLASFRVRLGQCCVALHFRVAISAITNLQMKVGKTVAKSHSAIRQNTDPVPVQNGQFFGPTIAQYFLQSPPLILKSRGS